MRPARVAVTAVACLTASLVSLVGAGAAPRGGMPATLTPSAGHSWQDLLARADAVGAATPFEARMVIVTRDADGPHVTEVTLRHGPDGDVLFGQAETWLVGRDGTAAFFRDERAGRLLRLGGVEQMGLDVEAISAKYDVEIEPPTTVDTGPAVPIRFRHGATLRERLYVDDATGLVVRRETFGAGGTPVRVVALTDLEITGDPVDLPVSPVDKWRHREAVDDVAGHPLADEGFVTPADLGEGFVLRSAVLVDDGHAAQLLYSDGLYSLSLYEQPGQVDHSALDGAVAATIADRPVYRWPGAEPRRMVWSGDGRTFTMVTDAPMDAVGPVLRQLPHDPAPGILTRLGRGLERVAMWIWPFD